MTLRDWQLTEDVARFRAAADAWLGAEPAANTIVLTVSETVRQQGPFAFGATRPARFGWQSDGDGAVVATFAQTPPRGALLGVMAPESARDLARTLTDVPSVIGEDTTVRAFAEASGRPWRVHRSERLYRLGAVTAPGPAPEGVARLATEADLPLLERWFGDFAEDIGEPRDQEFHVPTRVAERRLLLWEDAEGHPVSMVGWSQQVVGQVRVASVFTPAELRGRGYAGAAVERASRDLLASSAEQVLLFTDLANPTSNALYQRIGYRPLGDHTVLAFTDTDGDTDTDTDTDTDGDADADTDAARD